MCIFAYYIGTLQLFCLLSPWRFTWLFALLFPIVVHKIFLSYCLSLGLSDSDSQCCPYSLKIHVVWSGFNEVFDARLISFVSMSTQVSTFKTTCMFLRSLESWLMKLALYFRSTIILFYLYRSWNISLDRFISTSPYTRRVMLRQTTLQVELSYFISGLYTIRLLLENLNCLEQLHSDWILLDLVPTLLHLLHYFPEGRSVNYVFMTDF
jgi:hypothetical protein